MTHQYINPPELFNSLESGFSQVVLSQGTRLIHLSGQTAWNAEKRIIGGNDLQAQAQQALSNVQTALQAAGGSLDDVVSLRIYIVNYQRDEDGLAIVNALRTYFPTERAPATTWIGVQALASPDFRVEIEAMAVLEK